MIASVIATLAGVIVPISIPVLCGAILARWLKLEAAQLLTIIFYVMSPAIILDTMLSAKIDSGDVQATLLFALLNMFILWVLAQLSARAIKLPARETAGLTLVSSLTNCVNYGLPLVLLAFGQAGLEKATIYVVIMMINVNTGGVYFAARSNFSVSQALKSVFTLPSIYAALLALLLRYAGIGLPEGIGRGVSMLAKAYAPMVLLILGFQMAEVRTADSHPPLHRAFAAGMTIRLLLSPLVAWLVLSMLGIDGLLRSVLFIEASMPVAVNAVILAKRFDAAPATVSLSIFWSTLISFAVLPVLIVLVG